MSESSPNDESKKQFADVLMAPPGIEIEVSDLGALRTVAINTWEVKYPPIALYCYGKICEREMVFSPASNTGPDLDQNAAKDVFVTYTCNHCRSQSKRSALRVTRKGRTDGTGLVFKYGEHPLFGPHTPSRLISLIGPDRDLFLAGRRAENAGLGIGAFSYYRRVVDRQKARIISQIAGVARKLGASKDVLELLRQAEKEWSFSKSVDPIKDLIPSALLIDGHNPLLLLHAALSKGMHDENQLTDADCLALARDIRLIMTQVAERIAELSREDSELKAALGRLLKLGSGKSNEMPEKESTS